MGLISKKIKEYLSNEQKTCILSTANNAGETNIAIFGSFFLTEEETLMLMLGDNNSYANLAVNPYAALLITLPGKTGMQIEGCRIYLKLKLFEDKGEMFERMKNGVREKVGDAAEMLRHLVAFDIVKTRPILDMGQGV